MTQNYAFIIMALAAGLALQLYFTGWQTKRFYSRLKQIRKDGKTSIGLDGGIWTGRRYAVLVVDENLEILHAERFSGLTIFAKLKPVNELVGHSANDLLLGDSTFSLSKGMLKAFKNAAKELLKDEEESKSTITDRKIQSVKIIEKHESKTDFIGEKGKEVKKK
jgi:DNA-binding transcriptional regulator of glucitol operon